MPEELSILMGSQNLKQKTKAEICWYELHQGCGSKGKSPGILEDWLQSRAEQLIQDPIP
jgi:hypothetical protein